MTEDLLILAEVRIPLDRIAMAVGPLVHESLIDKAAPRLKARPRNEAVRASVERVISALDHLERVTHTVGESQAHEALLNAVRGLRKAHILNRKN